MLAQKLTANALRINKIDKSFGGVKAVKAFSLEACQGQIIGIIGPNGAGKTTIFNLISGIYKVDRGEIWFHKSNLTNKEQFAIARLGIARIFQNIRLFNQLSVQQNIMSAMETYSQYNVLDSLLQTPKLRREERRLKGESAAWLEFVGLVSYKDEKPSNLAYGLQRRLEIGRALASNPKVLLLDEPAAGLNPSEVQELIQLIRLIKEKLSLCVILIEHRMEVVMSLCEKIYVQNFGSTLACGTPTEIQTNDQVIKAYLGEDD